MTCNADGTATENKSLQGVWQSLHNPEPERQYRVTWQHGFEETFTCSADGQAAQGVNKHGVQFDARRLPPDQPAEPSANPFGTSGH